MISVPTMQGKHTSFYWRRRDLGLWRNMPKRGRNVNLKRVGARLGVSKAAAPSRVPYVGLDNLHSSVGTTSDRGGPVEVALGTRRGAAGGAGASSLAGCVRREVACVRLG